MRARRRQARSGTTVADAATGWKSGASLSAPRLIAAITERGSGGLEITSDAGEGDFQKLFELLSLNASEGETPVEINNRLKERGCAQIRLCVDARVSLAGDGSGKCGASSVENERERDEVSGLSLSLATGGLQRVLLGLPPPRSTPF